MKRYVLLFDGGCAACSDVARQVQDLAVTDLEVLALGDPQVTSALEQARLAAPDRPSLLVTGDDHPQILSVWPMRRRLASLVGWRRAQTIARLLFSEWQGRVARDAAAAGPSRRSVVGTGAAGVVGWVLFPRSTAERRKGSPKVSFGPAAAADVRWARATAPMRHAVRTWGPVGEHVIEVRDGSERSLVFTHRHHRHQVATVVDVSAEARHGTPTALSLGELPAPEVGIRFYTVDGVPLGDIVVSSDGKQEVRSAARQAGGDEPVVPDFNVGCWLNCMKEFRIEITLGCQQACDACFSYVGAVITCTHCFICAGGAKAVTCAHRCR